jgi:hypothetical protein
MNYASIVYACGDTIPTLIIVPRACLSAIICVLKLIFFLAETERHWGRKQTLSLISLI